MIANLERSQNTQSFDFGPGQIRPTNEQISITQITSAPGVNVIRRSLTHSFRFGPRIADIATRILQYGSNGDRKNDYYITGLGTDDPNSRDGICFIAPTNAELLRVASEQIQQNPEIKVHFAATSGADDWNPAIPYKFEFLQLVYALSEGRQSQITDPEIKRFSNWSELLDHGKRRNGDAVGVDLEIASAIGIVKKLSAQLPSVLERVAKSSCAPWDADVVFSTAHRAKGLEWDKVVMLEDFPELKPPTSLEEANLIYVAATRTRHTLLPNQHLAHFLA